MALFKFLMKLKE